MITVQLFAGLGNQLFKLASLEGIAHITNRNFYLDPRLLQLSPHSQRNYFQGIFKLWVEFVSQKSHGIVYDDRYFKLMDWSNLPLNDVVIDGYLQRWEYIHPIRDTFVKRLTFNTDVLKKYPGIEHSIFVHIRGGDYLGSDLHHVDLKKYYETCFGKVDKPLVIFTNDVEYSKVVLGNRKCVYITENEEDSLYLMSKCSGGICSNSTFSWWGAYLNPDRQIFMPSKWFLDDKFDCTGYFFPGSIVVEV